MLCDDKKRGATTHAHRNAASNSQVDEAFVCVEQNLPDWLTACAALYVAEIVIIQRRDRTLIDDTASAYCLCITICSPCQFLIQLSIAICPLDLATRPTTTATTLLGPRPPAPALISPLFDNLSRPSFLTNIIPRR